MAGDGYVYRLHYCTTASDGESVHVTGVSDVEYSDVDLATMRAAAHGAIREGADPRTVSLRRRFLVPMPPWEQVKL